MIEQESPELKATGKFIEAINTLEFSALKVALFLSMASPAIQRRVMDVFRHYIDILAEHLDSGRFGDDDEMLPILEEAKRINDYDVYGDE